MALSRILKVAGLDPDPAPLMAWLREHVDTAVLHEVATADSVYELDDNLEALQRVLDQGEVLDPVEVRESWIEEAVSLTQYGYRHRAQNPPGDDRRCVHLATLLAATVIVLGSIPGAGLESREVPLDTAVPNAALAARELGTGALSACRSMLAFAAKQFSGSEWSHDEAVMASIAALLTLDPLPARAVEALLSRDLDSATTPAAKERWLAAEVTPWGPWTMLLSGARWQGVDDNQQLRVWGLVESALKSW